jgi:hypothetical protein
MDYKIFENFFSSLILIRFFLTKKRQFCSLVQNKKHFTNGASQVNLGNTIYGCCEVTSRP